MNTRDRQRERARVVHVVSVVVAFASAWRPDVARGRPGVPMVMDRPGWRESLEVLVRDNRRGRFDVGVLVGASLVSWPALRHYVVTPEFLRAGVRSVQCIRRGAP